MPHTPIGLVERGSSHENTGGLGEQPSPSVRLAALAALSFGQQTSTLLLPSPLATPASFHLVQGEDKGLVLARSLVRLGLGSIELWNESKGDTSLFVRNSLNGWFGELGADRLKSRIALNLAIVDSLEGEEAADGKMYVLVETTDGCGCLFIGKAIERMEAESKGLGLAFYLVLQSTMNGWMEVYGLDNARYFFEGWKEGIRMDMEGEELPPATTFLEYCDTRGIDFPDEDRGCPACIRAFTTTSATSKSWYRRSRAQLVRHRGGSFADLIEPVLAVAGVRWTKRSGLDERDLGFWDDGPLPNWLLAFHSDDSVSQAFDEEGATMNEASHAPTWIEAFDPLDVKQVGRILRHARKLIEVNLHLVQLAEAIDKLTPSQIPGNPERNTHAGTDRNRLDGQLRAA